MKAIKKFNDAGFYHNAVSKNTIGVDSTGEIKMIDFEYTTAKADGAMNHKEEGYFMDAPSLFKSSTLRKDTDDMYTAVLAYAMMNSALGWNFFFPEIVAGTKKKCIEVRDSSCIEAVASRTMGELKKNFGDVHSSLTTSDFDFAHNKGENLDKAKVFDKATVGALLNGLLNQHRFKLTAAEFLDSYEFLMNKSGRRLLVR